MPAPKKSSSKRRRLPARRRDEPEPVLTGRLLIGMGVIAAMVLFPWPGESLAGAFVPKDRDKVDTSGWSQGSTVEVDITLITLDYDRLGCAMDRDFAGMHCEYKTETEPWPRDPTAPLDDNKRDTIQPYSMAPDNSLILVGGLWAQPEVAMRVQEEPFHSIAEKKLARFLARCRVRLVEQVPQAAIRWNKTQAWGKQGPAWVAAAESCQVLEEQ